MNRSFFHTLPDEPPPWWPEGEPWPPERPLGEKQLNELRLRFFWGVVLAFFTLVLILLTFAAGLSWAVMKLYGLEWPLRGPLFVVRFLGPGLIFTGAGSLFLASLWLRRALLPLSDLLTAARQVAKHDYSVRVSVRGPASVRELAAAFNSMAEQLQANDEQRRGLLADVSHELRTPLTIIQGDLEGVLDGIYPPEPELIQSVLDETHTLSRMIDDLRTLSLAESGALALQMELIDPGDLVQDSVDALRAHCGAYGVTLALEIEQALPRVEADPTRIREVISNLVTNAIRYTPAGGQIIVRGTSRRDPAGIQVSVQDSGSGIDPAELPHIFERFYKSSESSGSGLGLAISRGLVHAHHGQISAESSLGQGTCITFWLPAAG